MQKAILRPQARVAPVHALFPGLSLWARQKGIVLLPGSVGISPNAFNRCEALSCGLLVSGKMFRKHLPYQGGDAPLLPGSQRLEGFILPVFEDNMGLMHYAPPQHQGSSVFRKPKVAPEG